MKLKAETASETVDVKVKHDGDKVSVRVADREYDLDVSEPEPGIFLIKNDGKIYETAVSNAPENQFRVRLRNTEFEVSITDPKRLRGSSSDSEHTSGKAEIKTAMPGKVVRILKTAGDSVQKGDGLIVVEAMKMQNEMRSPKDGTIGEIKVAEGATVSSGDVLVVID